MGGSTRFALAVAVGFVACSSGSPPTEGERDSAAMSSAEAVRSARHIVASSELAYVSDYFSFVGRDAEGHVAFAIDNNRGRDGGAYQAEHFVVLHDEKRGFVALPGSSRYPNPRHELLRIPDSEFFSFEGEPATGVTIRAARSPLVLSIEPLALSVVRGIPDRLVFGLGSAAATLEWEGRTLAGRVITEFLAARDRNRLSRFDWGRIVQPGSFQGLYLETEKGDDLYLHRIRGGGGELGELLGFYGEAGDVRAAAALDFEATGRRLGAGL